MEPASAAPVAPPPVATGSLPFELTPTVAARTPEALALRAEILKIGGKLWDRQYVDGNGGNVSARIGSRYVLCTPTMMCKADLELDDICLSDLEGNILAGSRARTSEILLHLAIYKANPQARAVVHCHPPHATAFAITGEAPPNGLVAEYEYFVGVAALAPYETPGTQAFADTVIPYARHHNTILLANHGVVCWSDTVTHAEWLVETLDTYCRTLTIARQLGRALRPIPEEKIEEILLRKREAGLPDLRLASLPARTAPARL
ncbi:class II aldolase/adducin family protein [Acidobacteria bacterium AB60]|nr:class II aldolase/adducin family protein [Acidobacteria bacterium AB60]